MEESIYIGQTQFDVNHRMNQHKNGLREEGKSADNIELDIRFLKFYC